MSDAFALPEAPLAAYLERHVDGFRGPLTAAKFKGGQSNPTYRIDAASGTYVLRRRPPGKLLASAHAIDREFRVISALANSDVPVAPALHYCADESIIGSTFYVMGFVEGRIFWDPALPEIPVGERRAYVDEIVRVLAAIGRVDLDATNLADYGKPGNYYLRQIGRWTEQYRASATRTIPAMDALIETLPARCPTDTSKPALVHGDFRIDNLIFHPTEPRILAVVDWELSTLGDPLADLSYYCMALRLPRNPVIPGLGGLDRGELGLPDEGDIVERFLVETGHAPIADWPFYLAFNFFRLAAIAQGVAKRAEQGNAASAQAETVGRMVDLVAGQGAKLVARD
jgi:aminoglycoside phosphotransferase (APT) family kinase protein